MQFDAHRVIAIGASAGGVEALRGIARDLPADLSAIVLVVMHMGAQSPGLLPEILARAGPLPVQHAADGEVLAPGRIYTALPDHHLLVEASGRARLSRGPKENMFRPAIDPLFRSAAHAFGSRVIGVVLTGALDDGTAGLWTIKRHGGIALVQDPKDAMVSSMPLSALRYVDVDHCLPVAQIGSRLASLAAGPLPLPSQPEVREMDTESKILLGEEHGDDSWTLGSPSHYACPECHGTLQAIAEGTIIRYRCHVGHGYTIDSLLSELTRKVSEALWNALRAIEETAKLLRQEAEQAHQERDLALCDLYLEKTKQAQMNADAVRVVALRQERLNRQQVRNERKP